MLTALALCRLAHFLSAMTVCGASAFLWLFAPRALREGLTPRVWRLSQIGAVVAVLSGLLWLCLSTASMADDWSAAIDADALAATLTATAFGQVWLARLLLAGALVVWLVFARPGRWAGAAVLSSFTVASLGLVGHAAMQTGRIGALHRANDALHLIAASGWLGGLVVFILTLAAFAKRELRGEAELAMTRFSSTGHFNVLLILATGAINDALTAGALPWPPNSPYRALFVTKLALVATMLGLALVNRYVLFPRLEGSPGARRALRAFSLSELALGAGVVALVSLFGLLEPF